MEQAAPTPTQQLKPGAGSFWIPQQALEILLANNASASLACAYLVIAVHTDESGTKSTAGLGAIRSRLICRETVADKLVADLVQLGLIRDLRENKGNRSAKRAEVRFEVITFGENQQSRIWFSRSLVDIPGDAFTACSPLSTLNNMTPECIYVLIWLHSIQDDHWVSVRPPLPTERQSGVCRSYVSIEDEHLIEENHEVRVIEPGQLTFHVPQFLLDRFGGESIDRAIEHLKQSNFIYEVVMAYSRPLQNLEGFSEEEAFVDPESRPLFHVHGGSPKSGLPPEELGVSHLTLALSKKIDKKHVLYNENQERHMRFVVVSKRSQCLGVAGVIRLRYRVKNAKNLGVGPSWGNLMSYERDYRKWLSDLLTDHYMIIPERYAQHAQFEAKTEALFGCEVGA